MLKLIFPVMCLALLANTLSAAIIHPGSLVDGDKYRYAFVTSTTRDATSSDIADYDAHVNAAIDVADPTGLGAINWRAWGSTATVNAIDHLSVDSSGGWDVSSVPIYLINTSTLIANDFSDLSDGLIGAPINLNESGFVQGPITAVWTGTSELGTGLSPLGGSPNVLVGSSAVSIAFWSNLITLSPSNSLSLYGFSDVITVGSAATVPEPSSLVLMILGVGAIGVSRLRHRRRNTA